MPTVVKKEIIVSIPAMDMDVFKTIAKKFNWKISEKKAQPTTGFQKSQEDIKAGRVNTYKNSDELFKKLF